MESYNPLIARFFVANHMRPPVPKCEPLSFFAMKGRVDLIDRELRKGADIHVNEDEPLRVACEFGQYDVIRHLLEKGADPCAMNMYALKNARTGLVRLILKRSMLGF